MQLWEASANGDTASVQAILEQGADVNAKDNDGFTALMAAAIGGHPVFCSLFPCIVN